MTDTAARDAAAAIARRVRDRDAAMRDGPDYADPEPFADEIVAVLRGLGWRPPGAKPPPWKQPRPGPGDDTYRRGLAAARESMGGAT